MARLNSEETLWTVLPIIVVIVLLIVGIIFLPKASTDVRSRASEPKAIITPLPKAIAPSKSLPPEVVCSDLYSPVCGNDGITYPNSCEAGLVGITIFTEGTCSSAPAQGASPTPRPSLPTKSNPQMQYPLPISN